MRAVPYEMLEHTADIGFRTWGGSAAELFEHAAAAFVGIAAEPVRVEERIEIAAEVAGEDYASLLVGWLNEVLFLFDSGRIAPARFQVDEITPGRLRARVWGEPRKAGRHRWQRMVKAATYHSAEVRERNGSWEAVVYLDV